ncbi:programmed cell death protein 7 [Spea bombifrons]|uniref:programmed cell death protein 7 n=1 Tax=Spea bombifrons TaxID=233779 RepID=UPI002349653B|nr:programmed cell death protein 7 [Spea bombifrons]
MDRRLPSQGFSYHGNFEGPRFGASNSNQHNTFYQGGPPYPGTCNDSLQPGADCMPSQVGLMHGMMHPALPPHHRRQQHDFSHYGGPQTNVSHLSGRSQHPGVPQHQGSQHPGMPQHQGSQHPGMPQHQGSQHPGMPQHQGSQHPGMPQHQGSQHPGMPQHQGSQHPGMPQHQGSQHPGMPQHQGSQHPGMPQHPGPQLGGGLKTDMSFLGEAEKNFPQFLSSQKVISEYGGGQSSISQHDNVPPGMSQTQRGAFNYMQPPPDVFQHRTAQMHTLPIQNSMHVGEPNTNTEFNQMHRNLAISSFTPTQMDPLQGDGTDVRYDRLPVHQVSPQVPSSNMFMKEDHLGLQRRPDLQIESFDMNLNRQSASMRTFQDNGPSDKDMFQHWLSSFLAHRRNKLPPKSDSTTSLSIGEARELIYGALRLVSQLKTLCQSLECNTESAETWAQDFPKAENIRLELERRMKALEKPGCIEGVQRKLQRARKKRLRQQQGKQETEEDKEAAERAAENEARIDRWRMQRIHEVEERKRERELKATADSVLSEVRKKQADTKKMLDVLRSLEKLRKLRKEAAARKGVFPPSSADETFTNHIQRLRTMVQKRTALYDAEERALRVILEGEQEEERQREKQKRLKKEKEKHLKLQQEVDCMLFGDPDPLPPLHPLQPFRQYYLQAEHSVVSLVQIRHGWDQFLVPPEHPEASSIPRGWVLPKSPSSDTWATAVQQAE